MTTRPGRTERRPRHALVATAVTAAMLVGAGAAEAAPTPAVAPSGSGGQDVSAPGPDASAELAASAPPAAPATTAPTEPEPTPPTSAPATAAPAPAPVPTDPPDTDPRDPESGTDTELPVAEEPTPGSQASDTAPSSGARVRAAGVELELPTGWTVVDLDADPTACLRLDRNVVYLGTPGPTSDCPATVIGRTETAHVQALPPELPYGTVTLVPGAEVRLTAEQLLAGEVVGRVEGSAALVTATFATEPDVARALLESITVLDPAPSSARMQPQALAAAAPPGLHPSFTWHHGLGFDACTAPALSSMRAWLSSPYRAVGIYIGGASRSCAQPNLTASWAREVAALGWKAQPIYIGLQAPCSTTRSQRFSYGSEWQQGRDAALDAIARAQALGIGAGSDLYYDMEAYPRSSQCSGSVRAFLSSWTQTLHHNGYRSGVYSSAASGIVDLATGFAQPGYVPPDKLWIARWSGVPDVYAHDAHVPDTLWAPYQRIHQFVGNTLETYGGVTINIDRNMVDTDANRGNPLGRVERATGGHSSITATGWALDPDSSAPIIVQMYVDGVANAMVWANRSRPDVGAVFPAAGDRHGYSITMPASPGPHRVCLYAVNTGPGLSSGLGCTTVTALSSDPFGQVDAVRTTYGRVTASGWAIDPDTNQPLIVQMYVDGAANTMAWANRPRPDVGRYYPAAGPNHGYELSMPTTAGRHTVCLIAVNAGAGASKGLGCRVVDVPPSDPFGHLDSLHAAAGGITTHGWTIDPDSSRPVIVQLYVDGQFATMDWARLPRPDVARYYPWAGPDHGFTLTTTVARGRHLACVYAVNVGAGVSSSVGCRNVDVP